MKTSYSKAEHEFFMEAAKARANELREEAINDFVHGAGDLVRRAVRAANRFAHSLLRHRKLRREHGLG